MVGHLASLLDKDAFIEANLIQAAQRQCEDLNYLMRKSICGYITDICYKVGQELAHEKFFPEVNQNDDL